MGDSANEQNRMGAVDVRHGVLAGAFGRISCQIDLGEGTRKNADWAAAALNVWAVSDRVDEIIRLALYKPVWRKLPTARTY